MEAHKARTDLLPGTLDMLVLKILVRGHLHCYAIAQLIQQLSDDLLRVEEGSVYPAPGRKHLVEESARYRQVTGPVARIMGFA